nr:MAG TPA: hypothetical protein [Caudoviricetes sp.]
MPRSRKPRTQRNKGFVVPSCETCRSCPRMRRHTRPRSFLLDWKKKVISRDGTKGLFAMSLNMRAHPKHHFFLLVTKHHRQRACRASILFHFFGGSIPPAATRIIKLLC